MSGWSGQRGYRGKRRRGNGRWEQGPRKRARRREEEEDEEEDEDMAPAPSSFVTARDQHVSSLSTCVVLTADARHISLLIPALHCRC